MAWELIEALPRDWTQDTSGVYTLIHRIESGNVRIDVMSVRDIPLVSFFGAAENVRKAIANWFADSGYKVSLEHMAYIGYEICKAESEGYVQS